VAGPCDALPSGSRLNDCELPHSTEETNMDTDVLAELIDAKHELLCQIRQLAGRQAEVIVQGDMTRIMSLLAVKQRLLNSIEQLERRLDPFRQQEPEQRQWQSPAHRQRAREASTRCDALLNEIMAVERTCETQLLQRRDLAADQLRVAHFSMHAANAYLPSGDSAGGQFDVSCET
jgi:hypothetical protein